jgi:hypothetical protein
VPIQIRQDSSKSYRIRRLPELLVVHVNRARWLRSGAREKIHELVG